MNEYKHDVGYIHKHSLQLEEYDSMTERVETFIDKIHYCIYSAIDAIDGTDIQKQENELLSALTSMINVLNLNNDILLVNVISEISISV